MITYVRVSNRINHTLALHFRLVGCYSDILACSDWYNKVLQIGELTKNQKLISYSSGVEANISLLRTISCLMSYIFLCCPYIVERTRELFAFF